MLPLKNTKNPIEVNTMTRTLQNARLQRELGFYNESNQLFDEAIDEQPENIALALEAASVKLSQGLLGECQTALTALDARIDRNCPDVNRLHLGMLDVLYALSTATSTLRFSEPLDRAWGAYERLGLDKPVEAFDEYTVNRCGCRFVVWMLTGRRSPSQAGITIYWLYRDE